MILKINELQKGMSVIYKINYKDGHYYIGLTNDLKRRMSEHLNAWKKTYKHIQDCDKAIHEQGGIEEVEVLEFVPIPDLEEREQYWIKYYNAYENPLGYNKTPGGDGSNQSGTFNPNAVFSKEQVYEIRKRRFLGERKKDVYQDYSFASFSGFEKIWLGTGYNDVGQEFIIQPNQKSRQEYSHEANSGLKNGKAKASYEDIIEIRKRRDNGETFSAINKDFPHLSLSTVRRIALRESYKTVE